MSRVNMTPGNFEGANEIGNADEAVRQLNSLLRGEISAVETYRQAIDKVADSDRAAANGVGLLREIESEHTRAAAALRDRIEQLGGEPSETSGAWGAWAQVVQGTANLFGDTSALKTLKEGEEHGLKDYEEAVDDVDAASRALITGELIPRQQRHVSLIDQLMSATARS
jgi:uncharacterized protein (TIGR02284 family)